MSKLSWDRLRLAITLDELYPPRTVLSPRISPRWNRWAIPSPVIADFATGLAPILAGEMPVLVSRMVTGQRVREALGDRLPPRSDRLLSYSDEAEYAARIREAIAGGSKIALMHPVPSDEIPPDHCVVPSAMLSELGDKGRLAEWAGAEHVPARERVRTADLMTHAAARLPVAVKVVSDEPVAGGTGIRHCQSVSDLGDARKAMSSCEEVVVEKWLDLVRSECLTYAVGPGQEIRYLGAAQQMVTGVRFRGNRIDDSQPEAGPIAAGKEVVKRAAERGYVGLVGIDCGFLADGSFRILDLNFRINASTPLVILRPAMLDAIGRHHAISGSWTSLRSFAEFIDAIRRGCDLGWLLPMAVLDPETTRVSAPHLLSAILVGSDAAELAIRTARLSDFGLTPLFPP